MNQALMNPKNAAAAFGFDPLSVVAQVRERVRTSSKGDPRLLRLHRLAGDDVLETSLYRKLVEVLLQKVKENAPLSETAAKTVCFSLMGQELAKRDLRNELSLLVERNRQG